MSEMILEPLAAHVRFIAPAPRQIQDWTGILKDYFKTLATLCDLAGPCVIGHIKGLALLPAGGYIRVSAVSASMPVQIETNVSGDFAELTITLNMLVYGLPGKSLEGIAESAAARLEEAKGLKLTVIATTQSDHSTHDHGF